MPIQVDDLSFFTGELCKNFVEHIQIYFKYKYIIIKLATECGNIRVVMSMYCTADIMGTKTSPQELIKYSESESEYTKVSMLTS